MHETEANERHQSLLELEKRKKVVLQQIQELKQQIQERHQQLQEKDRQLQENVQKIRERDQQIQDYYRSQQSTTFCENIEGCHDTLCYALPNQPNGQLEKNESTTSTYSTACPVELREWVGFVDKQKLLFDEICDAFPPEHRAFDPPCFQEYLREDFNRIGQDVERSVHHNIERPVMMILESLQSLDGIDKGLRFGGNLMFDRSYHNTSMTPDEFVDGGIAASEPDITSCDNGRSGPDRLCVLSNPELTRASSTLLFVCELENHDRLPIERLREALQPATELGQASQSTALNAKVKNGVAQSYDYLMESSTGLGILVTVQALVFLRVDRDNPGTLLYHIAAPAEDVAQAMASDAARGISEATSKRNSLFLSAVGQYLAFTLMAMRHPRLPGQEARLKFIKHLPWKGRGHEDKNGASDSSGYCTDDSNIRGQSEKNTKSKQLSGGRKHRAQDWPYCSQRCLLGLVRGDDLDWTCPNVTLHCQGRASEAGSIHKRHSISHSEWLSLLRDQFEQSLDVGITYEGVFGARGRFFKVTLLAYGYTFVSKGAVSAHVKHLQHEADMYKQLEPMQGAHVPVFLGAIDLRTMRKNFWVDFGVHVVHMMFLSWGGHHIEQDKMARFEIPRSRLIEQAEQAIESVHGRGVLHGDVRWENVLFNPETSDVMVIDFERAGLLDKSRSAGQDAGVSKTPRMTIEQLRRDERDLVVLAVQERLRT
ncbi:hypothetical protein E4U48_000316 [Claviceps purpurea]|nr:hypothetical protein E4U48_000316 [Claviceps purpurea]